MTERKSEALREPVKLTNSQLALVAGGQAIPFVDQLSDARVSIGKHDAVVAALSLVADVVVSIPVTRSP